MILHLIIFVIGCVGLGAFVILAANLGLSFASVKYSERKKIMKNEKMALLVLIFCVGVIFLISSIQPY